MHHSIVKILDTISAPWEKWRSPLYLTDMSGPLDQKLLFTKPGSIAPINRLKIVPTGPFRKNWRYLLFEAERSRDWNSLYSSFKFEITRLCVTARLTREKPRFRSRTLDKAEDNYSVFCAWSFWRDVATILEFQIHKHDKITINYTGKTACGPEEKLFIKSSIPLVSLLVLNGNLSSGGVEDRHQGVRPFHWPSG